ncbi:hypothetical protein MANY_31810 [Mycolicibacterium anyangense]|uniref:Uncharacterized protein n=1 Tax=Mycolicibacterium anyangense TaxID=1431246 RepID=A0A6N4WCN8_9MYCO|nr:hypothetical protein MANY_31810 [Mycolicibacterium anyangense]
MRGGRYRCLRARRRGRDFPNADQTRVDGYGICDKSTAGELFSQLVSDWRLHIDARLKRLLRLQIGFHTLPFRLPSGTSQVRTTDYCGETSAGALSARPTSRRTVTSTSARRSTLEG